MDFDAFIQQAWSDHAERAAEVADRMAAQPVLDAAGSETQRIALARLAHHVHGEHLARWADGLAFQRRLAALPADASSSASANANADDVAAAVAAAAADATGRFIASLSLAGGTADLRTTLGPSDAIWVTALAATSLAPHDVARAGGLMQEAIDNFDAASLPASDPCTRALAVSTNNIANLLEELPMRSLAQRALMIQAAQSARRFWGLAGGWLEAERAEYRLAQTWLKAGDAAQAGVHAERCLAIVAANGNVALERFFGHEVLALALAAREPVDAQGAAGAAASVQAMREAFAELPQDDQAWCRASLDAVAATA